MSWLRRTAVCALVAMVAATACADVIFSNISITGSLSGGAVAMTGTNDIDFTFPSALVGDPTHPIRAGTIIITYEAESVAPLVMDQLLLSVLGGLLGSGTIVLNEVVEDFQDPMNPQVIATHAAILTAVTPLPYAATILFSQPSPHVKVKKTLVLTAVDTPALDIATVNLIEQRLREIPEPATLLPLALVGLAALRRR